MSRHSGPYARVFREPWAGTPVWAYQIIDPARIAGYRLLVTGARASWREAIDAALAMVRLHRRTYGPVEL